MFSQNHVLRRGLKEPGILCQAGVNVKLGRQENIHIQNAGYSLGNGR
jgi:hypothetical protein